MRFSGAYGVPPVTTTYGDTMNCTPKLEAEPLACSVRDACQKIGISHTKIYDLIADGSLKTVKIGKKRLVLVDSIRELLRPAA